jgi:hypothetical protein
MLAVCEYSTDECIKIMSSGIMDDDVFGQIVLLNMYRRNDPAASGPLDHLFCGIFVLIDVDLIEFDPGISECPFRIMAITAPRGRIHCYLWHKLPFLHEV